MVTLPDALATANAPIAAYMSGHESANLAYVKHFGRKTDAVSATFKSLNSNGFICTYKLADGSEHEVFIEYISPVTKREDVRPVLEEMAKEAEEALGMPSSLNGPPPFKALLKAAEIEDAQKSKIGRLQEDKDAETSAAIGNIYGFAAADNNAEMDQFISADRFWQSTIAFGLGLNAVFGYASNETFARLFPSFVVQFREYLTPPLCRSIFNWAVVAHLVEGSAALMICLKRGYYSPINTIKWTTSTLLYGFASMMKLTEHGKKVQGLKKNK